MRRCNVVVLIALLAATSAVNAQSILPVAPSQSETASLIATKAIAQADSKQPIDFDAWEKAMSDVKNVRVELTLTKHDAVFGSNREYNGVLLFRKPNFMMMRLNYTSDDSTKDFEAFIYNGKSLYQYNGLEKTVTEFRCSDSTIDRSEKTAIEWNLPTSTIDQHDQSTEAKLQRYLIKLRLKLSFFGQIFRLAELVSGTNPKVLRQRFEINVILEDNNYIYLEMKPIRKEDKDDFRQIHMALYGPKTKFAYLPAQIKILKPNGDTENWKITNPQTNIPGIDENTFQYVQVEGFKFRETLQTSTPEPAPLTSEKLEPTPITPDNSTTRPPVRQNSYPVFVECPYESRVRLRDRLCWRLLRN